ncbi:MAG TPA: amidohydrolase family protein, partial [Spirochaetia bacterium]|nr:amidohydrolase family protein [Spirochaetia bacterium]
WLTAEKAKWQSAWRFPKPIEVTREEAEQKWAAECEKFDYLEKIVFVTAGSNDTASELVKSHPDKFIAYAHHDPFLPDAPDRLERALGKGGLKGYKILGPSIEGSIADRSLYPLWEIAQKAEVPVLIHFGIEGAAGGIANHVNINPLSIHSVAKDFPRMRIIVPHFGCGYVFETLQLCWACPNISIDTSGSNQWMRWMPYSVNLEILFRKYYETIGPSRIIFGTDSSWFPRGFATSYLDEQVRAMVYVGYSEEERDMVLYRNAAELLKVK